MPVHSYPLLGLHLTLCAVIVTLGAACAQHTSATQDAGSTPTSNADINLAVSASAGVATVGVAHVRIANTLEVSSLTLRYGTEPQDLDTKLTLDPNALVDGQLRTTLLGLKQDTQYHARVDAQVSNEALRSEVVSFTTGALLNGLPPITIDDIHPEQLYGGFTVACTGAGIDATWAFIFDQDGDYVWAHPLAGTAVETCSRARMSYDGQFMWIGNVNVHTSRGALLRVPMDGLGETRTYELPGRHHDFVMLPNGHLAYIAQANGGSSVGDDKHDLLLELDPETGESTELYSEEADFGALFGEEIGHTNYITYVPTLAALSFSMRNINTIGLVSYPEGKLLGKFGGPETSFEAMNWSVQHGHHLFEDRLIVFSNHGPDGETLDSRVLEYTYDLQTSRAELTLEYTSGNGSITFGEARELPNGNLFITYSNSGVIHEVSAEGELLREVTLDPIGYTEHRKSLYGPPPPYDTATVVDTATEE